MVESRQIVISTERQARSLCWQGDSLIDWADGGTRYRLDGTIEKSYIYCPYRFDNAVSSPDGIYAIVYETFGTKALILKNGSMLRELNRSYYFANTYEYPIAIFNLPDGRTAIAHCPDSYSKIEIEEIETGRRLTERNTK